MSSNNCFSVCGMSLHHRCIEKLLETPLHTAMKWYFHVWIVFLAMFCLWSSGGTSWYVIPVAVISCLYAMLVLLSRTCRFGVTPNAFIRCNAHRLANIISPSVLFFIGSTHIESESIWAGTIMYLFPWIEMCGNYPVLSVYIVSFGS